MSADILPHFLRWLREELVRALLLGAWAHVTARSGAAQVRAFARFARLVDATPCWPCAVEYMHPRAMQERAEAGLACWQTLLIHTGEDIDMWEEQA